MGAFLWTKPFKHPNPFGKNMINWIKEKAAAVFDFTKTAVNIAKRVIDGIESINEEPPLSEQYKRYSRDMDVIAQDTIEIDKTTRDLARQDANKLKRLESTLLRSLSETDDFKHSITQKLELVRLGLEATSIDRHVQNLAIHSANLSVHLQTIRNIIGITDDVSKIANSLNDVISAINESSESKPKIPSIDLSLKNEAYSITAAYKEFENCRRLIERAAVELRRDIAKHQRDINTVREEMALAPAYGESIVSFLDDEISPQLKIRSDVANVVLREIRDIPLLQLEVLEVD